MTTPGPCPHGYLHWWHCSLCAAEHTKFVDEQPKQSEPAHAPVTFDASIGGSHPDDSYPPDRDR